MLILLNINYLHQSCTVNQGSEFAIDLSGKLIEIYVKPLPDRNIDRVSAYYYRTTFGHFNRPLTSQGP